MSTNAEVSSTIPIRFGLRKALYDLTHEGEPPIVVTADLAGPLGLVDLPGYPSERLINVGVAEQAMVGIACGVADAGLPVVAASFASFVLRAMEQIRNLLVLDQFNVVVVGSHAGVATGPNGATHQSIEDIGAIAALGSISVWSPGSASEAAEVIKAALRIGGPHYVRLSRAGSAWNHVKFEGPWSIVWPCDEPRLVVVTHGLATSLTWLAITDHLDKRDQDGVKQIHISRVSPLSGDALSQIFLEEPAACILTVEDHATWSGLAALLSYVAASHSKCNPLTSIGADSLPGSDDGDILLSRLGLSPASIASRIRRLMDS